MVSSYGVFCRINSTASVSLIKIFQLRLFFQIYWVKVQRPNEDKIVYVETLFRASLLVVSFFEIFVDYFCLLSSIQSIHIVVLYVSEHAFNVLFKFLFLRYGTAVVWHVPQPVVLSKLFIVCDEWPLSLTNGMSRFHIPRTSWHKTYALSLFVNTHCFFSKFACSCVTETSWWNSFETWNF